MILEITILFLKIHFLNYKKVMSPEEIYSQLLVSLWILNLCLKCYTFCLYFILYLNVWIRIHKASEYGSNTDPDPQPWFELFACITKNDNNLFVELFTFFSILSVLILFLLHIFVRGKTISYSCNWKIKWNLSGEYFYYLRTICSVNLVFLLDELKTIFQWKVRKYFPGILSQEHKIPTGNHQSHSSFKTMSNH